MYLTWRFSNGDGYYAELLDNGQNTRSDLSAQHVHGPDVGFGFPLGGQRNIFMNCPSRGQGTTAELRLGSTKYDIATVHRACGHHLGAVRHPVRAVGWRRPKGTTVMALAGSCLPSPSYLQIARPILPSGLFDLLTASHPISYVDSRFVGHRSFFLCTR